MTHVRRPAFVLAAFGVILAVSPGGRSRASGQKEKPDLSGRWALNQSLSDDPMEKLHERAAGRSSGGRSEDGGGHGGFGMHGGRGGYGGGRGGYGGGGRGGGSRGEGGADEGSGTPNELLWDVSHLVVTDGGAKDPSLVVERADGGTRVLYTDGRKVEEETGAGTTKIKTKRKSDKVVVDTEYPNGREVVETWEVTSEPRHLVVTTKIEGKRGKFSFRRVYDPEPEGQSAAVPARADGAASTPR